MPIRPPALDDRSFDDLVNELVARIPAHTPEWTNPRPGDPGRTLIELFAWLGDTILYRANLIPERQRLAFLHLLGMPLKPAVAARGMVSLLVDDEKNPQALDVPPGAVIRKPIPFQTTGFVTAYPLLGQAYIKRKLTPAEAAKVGDLLGDLVKVYSVEVKRPGDMPVGYRTTAVFENGAMNAAGVDFIDATVDRSLWIALMAPSLKLAPAAHSALAASSLYGPRALNVGVALAYALPGLDHDAGTRAPIPTVWELSTGRNTGGEQDLLTLEQLGDTTQAFTRHGVVRLGLPDPDLIGAPSNDPRDNLKAGVGDAPPRLDDPDDARRVVAWLRLRVKPGFVIQSLKLSWVGVNAVQIEQREALPARAIGVSDGGSDQSFDLGVSAKGSVDADALAVEVNDPTFPQQNWFGVDDLGRAGPLDPVYRLDPEAGLVTFGDAVHGRVPAAGSEIVVRGLRVGGGTQGNLAPDSLTKLDTLADLVTRQSGAPKVSVKVIQALPTSGGADAETVENAETRIPAHFRHQDRVVVSEDYRRLAREAPGADVGRVCVLPLFKPQERLGGIPGVVSVMVLPARNTSEFLPPYPRADRPLLEALHAFLDERRPLTTELYSIGCVYVALGVSVGVQIRDGHAREEVLMQVRLAVRRYLWPLPQGRLGSEGDWPTSARADGGYPLGRNVTDRELEVVVARVQGVAGVAPVRLFKLAGGRYVELPGAGKAVTTFTLNAWELPELTALTVVEGVSSPASVTSPFGPAVGDDVVILPVVPEVC
jgi:predicted phage baseplate assembly protein